MTANTPTLFVTASDTDVGKTLTARALIGALRVRGLTVACMKPVETGCTLRADDVGDVAGLPGQVDRQSRAALDRLAAIAGPPPATYTAKTSSDALLPRDALALIAATGRPLELDTVNPYRYAPPIAPAAAALLAERPIELEPILAAHRQLASSADIVIVEGAGGLLVPLNDQLLLIELIAALDAQALLVARSSLGTINHTLLSIEALRHRNVKLAGVVLTRHRDHPSIEEATNPQAIDHFAGDCVLGVLPYFNQQQLTDDAYLAERLRVHLDLDRLCRTIGL